MKEFWTLLTRFDLKGLLVRPTTNPILQFVRYIFVGGFATIVDWGVMYLLTDALHIHYLLSSAFAFLAGLLTNFLLSKLLVFSASGKRFSVSIEFLGYAFIGLMGLAFTELILYLMTSVMGLHYMLSKIAATFIVLFWNYFARKILLYRDNP